MEASLIKIGNSKGVIIPSKLLKLVGLKEKINIEVLDDKIIIAPAKKVARDGWEEMIKEELAKNGPQESLMPDVFEDEDLAEWKW